jgi:hypothetical protein
MSDLHLQHFGDNRNLSEAAATYPPKIISPLKIHRLATAILATKQGGYENADPINSH